MPGRRLLYTPGVTTFNLSDFCPPLVSLLPRLCACVGGVWDPVGQRLAVLLDERLPGKTNTMESGTRAAPGGLGSLPLGPSGAQVT